jgi:succinyl-CoA synthetase beta subunit
VLVNHGIDIEKEFYFAILMDRSHNGTIIYFYPESNLICFCGAHRWTRCCNFLNVGPVMVASRRGGMNIEEVAEEDPSAIFTEPVDIMAGVPHGATRKLAARLGFEGAQLEDAARQMEGLYALFLGASLL